MSGTGEARRVSRVELGVAWLVRVASRLDAALGATGRPGTGSSSRTLLLLVLLAGPIYGAAMGSFHFAWGERVLMVVYAAIKVPLLIGATSVICLPGYFVIGRVLRLRDGFAGSARAILAGQAALALGLAGLAPVTRFVYWCGLDHRFALLWNLGVFALATGLGHVVMQRGFRELIARDERQRIMIWLWVVMYAFVGVQMGWTLRPFVGTPGIPVSFFRQGPLTNAYVEVAKLVLGTASAASPTNEQRSDTPSGSN